MKIHKDFRIEEGGELDMRKSWGRDFDPITIDVDIDIDLLREQRDILLEVQDTLKRFSYEWDALEGVINLLDYMIDKAEEEGTE